MKLCHKTLSVVEPDALDTLQVGYGCCQFYGVLARDSGEYLFSGPVILPGNVLKTFVNGSQDEIVTQETAVVFIEKVPCRAND